MRSPLPRPLLLLAALSLVACSSERPPEDPAATRSFTVEIPAAVPSASYERFIALGDWGTGGPDQRVVAEAMGRWAAANPVAFVITVGDNFYPQGVKSADDSQWEDKFEEVYDAPSLQVPFYGCLGNHDHEGEPDAQVAYGQRGGRWVMPARHHDFVRELGDGTKAHFFVVDSTPIHEGDDVAAQLRWLDERLAASDARWKIVAGHHPLWTHSGRGDDRAMLEALEPLLLRHRVDLYLAGHDHILELIEEGGVHYVVSGAGAGKGKSDRVTWVEGDTLYASTGGGFVGVRIGHDELVLEFVRSDARTQYAHVVRKR